MAGGNIAELVEINVKEYRWGNKKIDIPETLATQGTEDDEKKQTNKHAPDITTRKRSMFVILVVFCYQQF